MSQTWTFKLFIEFM